jgi:predicted site-specific integrase-resolvase
MEQDLQTLQTLQLLNEKQAARLLACSVAALRRWRREGRGPQFTRLERCVRYEARAIERFVAENSSTKKEAGDRKSPAQREVRHARATTRT